MKKILLSRLFTGVFVPLALVLVIFFTWNPFQTVPFIPISGTDFYTIHAYSDSVKNTSGASSIRQLTKDSLLSFSYILGEGNPHPFAGISIQSKENAYFDLSSYDFLHLTIAASQGKRIQILLGVYTTGYTISDNIMTYRYLVKDLDLVKNQHDYTIPLKEFTTATWWYAANHVSEKDFKNVEFDKTKLINIQNCQLLGKNIPDTISIHGLQFEKNTTLFYGTCLTMLTVYYLVWGFAFYLRRTPKTHIQKIEIHYNPIPNNHPSEEELHKIITFISAQYQDSELSLRKIQLTTGISESKVSTLLKEKFNLPFKQYLNQLRLNEAKRLLLETDLPISDIAYKVGYGNISHFNRVFKEAEGTSPNDFRKKIKA